MTNQPGPSLPSSPSSQEDTHANKSAPTPAFIDVFTRYRGELSSDCGEGAGWGTSFTVQTARATHSRMAHWAPTGGAGRAAGWGSDTGKASVRGTSARPHRQESCLPRGAAFFHLTMGLALNRGATGSHPWPGRGRFTTGKGAGGMCWRNGR